MEFIQYPLALIITIGVLVSVHEFGHFVVARKSGVKVLKFSVGFGSTLFGWKGKTGTEFVIAAIPLGGYLQMGSEADGDNGTAALSGVCYEQLNVWWRIAIAFGGPLANFLLAIFIYWIIFIAGSASFAPVVGPLSPITVGTGMQPYDEILKVDDKETQNWQQVSMALANRMGDSGDITIMVATPGYGGQRTINIPIENWLAGEDEPKFLEAAGISPVVPPIVGGVIPDGAADRSGLKQWDRIQSINGIPVYGWTDWVEIVRDNADQPLSVVLDRGGSSVELMLIPDIRVEDGQDIGFVGVEAYVKHIKYGVFSAVQESIEETWDKTYLTLSFLKKMVIGELSAKTLSGPVAIAKVAADSAGFGWRAFISMLALLSISLGVLNLLPIPVLDGGHIIYCFAEVIRGRPLPPKVQVIGNQLGIVFVGGLMVFVIYNDVVRLL